ncbi:MAG: hypothetical protein V7638_3835 [Acidobacteriota bacterium]
MSRKTTQKQADYTAYGKVREMMDNRDLALVFSGPAGTGKTRGCLEKLDAVNRYFPSARTLLLRKTRSSLTQSSIVIFERQVLAGRFAEKPSRQFVYFHNTDMEYRYPNGSVCVIGGLDKSAKVMSAEYDLIVVDEGTEITEDDFQDLITRLRNGKTTFHQLLLACNPDAPIHFLKKRADAKLLKMIFAQHTDNPKLFDQEKQEWTPAGVEYVLGALESLTGTKRLRLRDGIWCSADGLVFDGFREDIHFFYGWNDDGSLHKDDSSSYRSRVEEYKTEPPKSWARSLSVDFGHSNPFVCQFWAADEDGRLYMYREIYMSGVIVEDHAAEIIRLCEEFDEPGFDEVYVDHDAEDRATLERHLGKNWRFQNLQTQAATKERDAGCDMVRARLKLQLDGRPRLFIRRDATVKVDEEMEKKKKPTSTHQEIWGYVYGKDGKPVKENDHGCDAMRYRVASVDLAPEYDYARVILRR